MVSRTGYVRGEAATGEGRVCGRQPLTDLEVVLFGSTAHEDVESAVHILHTGILA